MYIGAVRRGWCTFGVMHSGSGVQWGGVYWGWCTGGSCASELMYIGVLHLKALGAGGWLVLVNDLVRFRGRLCLFGFNEGTRNEQQMQVRIEGAAYMK